MRIPTPRLFACAKSAHRFKTKSGDGIKFNVFLLILGFSRFIFLMVTESRDRMQVEFCLACAFKKIGGVPREILFLPSPFVSRLCFLVAPFYHAVFPVCKNGLQCLLLYDILLHLLLHPVCLVLQFYGQFAHFLVIVQHAVF